MTTITPSRGCVRQDPRRLTLQVLLVLWAACGSAASASALPCPDAQPIPLLQDDDGLEELLAEERAQADQWRRRGLLNKAVRLLTEHVGDEPSDAAARRMRARCWAEQGLWERAASDAGRALRDARKAGAGDGAPEGARELLAACVRERAGLYLLFGEYAQALELLEGERGSLNPAREARDALLWGRVLMESGDREAARRLFEQGARSSAGLGWEQLVAKADCERALGRLERASQTLVAADRAAAKAGSNEADVLAALGALYFESEREVEVKGKRPAGQLFKEALELNPTHEGALLGLFELHRYNFRRQSRSPDEILDDLFDNNPNSIDGLIAQTSADLEDGQLKSAREVLARLDKLAPARREVRTLRASLAWIEHRKDDCREILDELSRTSPADSLPVRTVGGHLNELYRFAEAAPFLAEAVERDPTDYLAWTWLGKCLANTGDEDGAREAFEKARISARGRQDAWRKNSAMVLERMHADQIIEERGELTFAWAADSAEVLRVYLGPFYEEARVELARRYGHTPGPTRIEVFRRHEDFSVRSVGFPGFPALGVCFGPVVTALSPLSEMRGQFSWARTSFHEFSHVVHLGLSHNRCPRWITEGLATWEEVNRNPTWTRNLRRELVDSRANDNLIPVRRLNRAFRGPRIIFGYYQGGLLCEMLIRDHGFPPMVRLLEAFDRGLDLDEAFAETFEATPEEIDTRFKVFVDERIADLLIEPRWTKHVVSRMRLNAARTPPADPTALAAWGEELCTIAWGSWQAGQEIDAQEALRRIKNAGIEPMRARFLRGEMALSSRDPVAARKIWETAVEDGGKDFRVFIALGSLCLSAGEIASAEKHFLAAEAAFPGFDSPQLSAERRLVALYQAQGDVDAANRALDRWCAWNAGVYKERLVLADWHAAAGRDAQALRLIEEANEVDPFARSLHRRWGDALRGLGRHEEALREYHVAAIVPPNLDAERNPALTAIAGSLQGALKGADLFELNERQLADLPPQAQALIAQSKAQDRLQRAQLLALTSHCLDKLGRAQEAAAALERSKEIDPAGVTVLNDVQ